MVRLLLSVSLLILSIVPTCVRMRPGVPSVLTLTFLDVGQGDACLLRLPGGGAILVDGGPGPWDPRPYDGRLLHELAARGITRLERIVLSHPDWDHLGGLVEMGTKVPVGEVCLNKKFLHGEELPRLARWLEEHRAAGSRVRAVAKGARLVEERGVTIDAFPVAGAGANDRSLVLFIEYRTCRALLTGDISAQVESTLPWNREVTVLKVGHHGSASSSSAPFLRRHRPRIAVISSGLGNRYGHPDPRAVSRLIQAGADVLRTDFHGSVELTFDARGGFRCRSWMGSCGEGTCR